MKTAHHFAQKMMEILQHRSVSGCSSQTNIAHLFFFKLNVTYMSVSHDNDMSGVTDACLPCSVCTAAWDPTPGVYVKLGHAQWPIAEEIWRNRTTIGRGRQGEGEDVSV